MRKVIILLMSVALVLLMPGCSLVDSAKELFTKESITAEDFSSSAEAYGFEVVDMTEMAKENFDGEVECYLAVDSDAGYVIEFYIFEDNATAQDFAEFIDEDFWDRFDKIDNKSTSSSTGTNYWRASYKTDSSYAVVSQIDNTCLVTDLIIGSPDELNGFIKSIKYI